MPRLSDVSAATDGGHRSENRLALPLCVTPSQAVLLIDGIDELDPAERHDIELEIQQLIHSTRCKLLLTARTGSVTRTYESVILLELRPLTAAQQRQIASLWIGDQTEYFFDDLDRRPYADLCDRPLFLVRLLLLFKRDRVLPHQACDVYERFIRLMLEDWDRERDISRLSRYGNFGPDQKLRFLAALANYLLIQNHSVGFDRRSLERAYIAICDQFQLPQMQAEQVVQEVISHTGLIVQSAFDAYEFSHLSLQEYLCAHHMIRDPLNSTAKSYMASYAAPLAIAATMSVDPSGFVALLILTTEVPSPEFARREAVRNWNSFLRRLANERPKLSAGCALGIGALKLISDFPELENPLLTAVMANNDELVLLKSIASVVSAYELHERGAYQSELHLSRVSSLEMPSSLPQPKSLNVPISLFSRVSQRLGTALQLSGGSPRELVVLPQGELHVRLATQWKPPTSAG